MGEIRELPALGLDESEGAVGGAELGMEVEAQDQLAVGGWLALVGRSLAQRHSARTSGAPARR
ncbi:hypothetical protein AB0L75_20695 [Streptomyces sp. NPDC052101]|uniref:hypothetical protein n=1 Tax=Streptomyces sp. NPDC052101 TaxID=3155763 RepID=UPI0034316B4D